MAIQPQRIKFNVEDLYRMAETGLFKSEDRIELIEGDIVQMAPIGSRHTFCVNRITKIFAKQLPDSVLLSVQNPVRLHSESELYPDIAVVEDKGKEYKDKVPQAKDTFLIIEVSDSTLSYDREKKIPLYAKAGILETWLVNIEEECVFVYLNPSEIGYKEIRINRGTDEISPKAFPEICFLAKQVFE